MCGRQRCGERPDTLAGLNTLRTFGHPDAREIAVGVIPLGDASRRPTRFPVVTASIVLVNALVFCLELLGGEAFVTRWALIPADIPISGAIYDVRSGQLQEVVRSAGSREVGAA